MRLIILLITFFSLISCHKSNSSDYVNEEDIEEYIENTGSYPDGTYCAEIEYYNPNTGTRNTYNLDVEVEGGDLVKIIWPNGGWLDESHFYSEDISDGSCSFRSDKGYTYNVTLEEFGGCGYTDSYRLKRDIEDDLESITCPRCGGEKDSYDDLCYDCQKKVKEEEEEERRSIYNDDDYDYNYNDDYND